MVILTRWALVSSLTLLMAALPLALASEAEEHGGHEEGKNEIALFIGLTDEAEHPTEFTSGLEYERRLTEEFGIGALFDYAGGDLRNTVVAAVFYWHPSRAWKLLAAPGVEYHSGRGPVEGTYSRAPIPRDPV